MKFFKILIPIFILVLIAIIFIFSSGEPKVLKVGLITDLSGKNSGLGVSARSGLTLAIDEINRDGGINNHTIELLIKDHQGSIDLCYSGTRELVSQGVNVIISPILSGMASTVIKGVGSSNVLIIGPTVSSDDLTGIDDNFLRVATPSSVQGVKIAEISIKRGDRDVVLILDSRNSAYTSGVAEGYIKRIKNTDVNISKVFEFSNSDEIDGIVDSLLDIEPGAIFLVADGIDSAKVVQYYAKEKPLPHLYGGSWVKASGVHEYGGSRVEGMIIADAMVNPKPQEREVQFNKKYFDKFGTESNTVAIYFYESMYIYKDGGTLSKSFDGNLVKDSILKIENFNGILEPFSIDKYGDGVRSILLYIIKDNKYDFYNE
ncbi:ABC transporter substrate-binding protein [Thiospirochaeta perfilievii]|nr:ABC transporter substrate-binding protein [Thiospirochaeta perfilievii]